MYLHIITVAIQESLNLDEILKMILEHIQLQGYDRARIYLYDEMQKGLIGVVQVGSLHYTGFEGVRLPIVDDSYSQKTFESKNAQIYRPPTMEEGMPTGTLERVLIRAQSEDQDQMIKRGWEWAELPLIVVEEGQDRIVGKISLDNAISKRPLQQERLERLMAYASHAAIAIRHAQLHQQMIEQVEIRTTELNKTNEQFRQLAEHIREVFWMTSAEKDEMLYVSPGYEEIWGRTCESLYASSLTWVESIHPEDRDRILHAAKTKQVPGEYDEEYRIVRPDGSMRWIHDRAFPIEDESGNVYRIVGIAEDITERKEMEQDLIRTQRLRAAGELSAGVSHNLNNILSGIMGPAELLKMMTKDKEIIREADEILVSSERARELVHRLHLSTRGIEEGQLQPVLFNEIIEEVLGMARPRWKDEPESRGIAIQIETELEDVPPVKGTQSRCHDILVNLLFNAVDAMPEGGRITVQTQLFEGDVLLIFSDTGKGMDAEIRERVFEPFFTTKSDVGTGLGLSTVYNTVTKWGGSIEVESEPGTVTTFSLRLPVWTELESQEEEKVEARAVRPGKILIVEDDENVLRFLSRLLSRYHDVETVSDGRKAVETFSPGQYDAAVIDLGLPELPGDGVAREMCLVDPCLATVLVTGWELPKDDPRLSAFDFQIQKPFTGLDRVLNTIAQAIELHDDRMERG